MNVYLRSAVAEDHSFLHQLNRAAYEDLAMRLFGAWDDRIKRQRLTAKLERGGYQIIEFDAQPIGAIWSEERHDHIFIHDLMILPQLQRRGIGTHVLGSEIVHANSVAKPLRLHTSVENEARHWYPRLGFFETGRDDEFVDFERLPDAPVEVLPYDPLWPGLFESESALLQEVLSDWLVGSIEHVGSTAVVGLSAKPVIDIMAGVESLAASEPAKDALLGYGYQYAVYKTDVMHWFCKPSFEHRTHHLHLVPHESHLWQERLAFRNLLRSDATMAAEYAELKLRLAEKYRFDREAYTEAKYPFILQALKR